LKAPGIVEHDELAVEHVALRQEFSHLLEPLHPIAVARSTGREQCQPQRGKPSNLGTAVALLGSRGVVDHVYPAMQVRRARQRFGP
jgi:hypothetical protein